VSQEGFITLTTEQSLDINATGSKIFLTNTDVDTLRKQLLQLCAEPGHLSLGHTASLLLTPMAATATAAALTLRLIELVTVVFHTEIISGSAKPVILCVDLLFGDGCVGDFLGEIDARTKAGHDPTINIERLEREFLGRCITLSLVLLGIDLSGKTGDADNLFGGTNQDTLSRGTGTSGTTGSVDVHVCCAWDVVMNDTVNSLDVETTGCDVGGDKD
jgi:hypothetical protein